MHVDPRRLPILLAVHREGGIVAAADILHVSPSAVSQQLKKLEEEVGLQLFERQHDGTVLTPAGRLLASGAERLENDLADIEEQLRPLTGQVTGTVTIGSFQTALRCVLIPFLPHLDHHLPGIALHLAEVEENEGLSQLRTGKLDILLIDREVKSSPTPRGYEDHALIDEPWVVITPDTWPRLTGTHDLANLTWLRPNPDIVGTEPLRRVRAEVGKLTVAPYSYSTYDTALALLRAGLGATVLPSMAVSGIDLTGLRVTPMPHLGSRKILLRHKRGANQGPTAQVITHLMDWVQHSRTQ
ncbi:LysR family transcriptional regulator [Schaalia suimastitidis]|uniref:LysR family transcriptional regulator n=1 Tax=Schaalia suimastitidis TaxID=121163 RepID=UPI00041ABB94|nr:LysR family transcriptional regulator [Schaalia suimastitidis]